MTSQINTNGIDVNYPIPGQNNSSQGFRDNFAQIRTQLNTGANEITDLQSKVVVKAALNNSTLNNDMGNTLISNASTRGFRATTYNLGNALAGTVTVDVNRADVQFGALQGNVVLAFGNWAPTNTQSNVVLRLTFANNLPAYVSLPNSCVSSNNNFGVTLLENYANVNGTATLSAPANANIIELRFSTIDCGNTVTVEPINRPYQTTQIVTRNPAPTGLPGDVNGDVAVGASIGQITATATANVPTVITANTFTSTGSTINGTTLNIGTLASGTIATGMLLTGSGIVSNTYIESNQSGTGSGSIWTVSQSHSPAIGPVDINGSTGIIVDANNIPILTVGVQTSGTVQEGMIISGNASSNTAATALTIGQYYAIDFVGTSNFMLAGAPTNTIGTVFLANNTAIGTGTAFATIEPNTWIVQNISGSGTGSKWRVSAAQYAIPATINGNIDVVTVSDTTGFYRDMPITFTGTTFGGITTGSTYYIKEVADGNSITLSTSPGGTMLALSNASGTMSGNPVTYMYLATNDYNSSSSSKTLTNTYITTNNIKLSGTANLAVNAPIVFTGNVFGGITANTVYYVKTIDSGNSNITVSQSRYDGIAGSTVLLTTSNGTATATCYTGGNDIWQRISFNAW